MKRLSTRMGIMGLAGMLAATPTYAKGSDALPLLHVSDAYKTCFFDLHPELTAEEFKTFAGEVGSIIRFRQLGDTRTLGKGTLDIGVQWPSSLIDDAKGAWNNTMSHPTADHVLGDAIAFPRIVARVGLTDRVDLGGWGSINPRTNYGIVGVDTTVAIVRQGAGSPVSFSIRPSLGALLGPQEVWASNASLDLSVSRAFGAFAPYAGVATTASTAFERSADVNLDPATATGSAAYAGVSYAWRRLMFAAEVEKGTLTSYGFRIGRQF